MIYLFQFYPYQRFLKKPLVTYHGTLTIREGIIVHLTDGNGKVGKGEIAPLPWFGSETLEEALAFCEGVGEGISLGEIMAIPDRLSACQFAFASAWEELSSPPPPPVGKLNFSYLLPAGAAALNYLREAQAKAACYKWKIGVDGVREELALFGELLQLLPASAQLRLDANGGLNISGAREWLQECDRTGRVEFIEQPLGVEQLEAMLELGQEFQTPIALDESVANLQQLKDCYQQGWRGIFVIKAAIAGYPHLIGQFCREHQLDTVISSVFETKVGRQAALRLAAEVMLKERALGFGIAHWFTEDI